MKLTNEEKQTIDAYNKHARQWAQSRQSIGKWSKEHEKNTFQTYLPKGKILEIGAGGGWDAQELIKAGYDYTGTDISEGLLSEAKNNNPDATFLLKSVYELNFPTDSFDGFWAAAVLLHLPKNKVDDALQQIHNVVRHEGIGYISLKEGEGERFVEGDNAGIQYKRFFSFYKESEFTEILERNRFKILKQYMKYKTNKNWLIYFVEVMK